MKKLISKKQLRAQIAAKDALLEKYYSLEIKNSETIDGLSDRVMGLHEKIYKSGDRVKFITSFPGGYLRTAILRDLPLWPEEGGEAATTVNVTTEDIEMSPIRCFGKEIRVGYSELADCWYFCLEER